MRFVAALGYFLLVSLTMGAIATAAQGPAEQDPSELRVDIPSGNIDDAATFFRESRFADGRVEKDQITIRIGAATWITDHAGSPRQVVSLTQTGEVGDTSRDKVTRTDRVDLTSRRIVLTETTTESPDGRVETVTGYGPDFVVYPNIVDGELRPRGAYRDPNDFWVRFSGTSIHQESDVGSWRATEIVESVPSFGADRAQAHVAAIVDQVGSFGDQTAVSISEAWDVEEPSTGFESHGSAVYWFVDGRTFPVHVEIDVEATQLGYFPGPTSLVWTMVAWEAGTEPIPWQANQPAIETPVAKTPSLEWPLEEGAGSRLPIRLERVSRIVEEDPSLVGFTAWRAANPGWQLIGADLRKGVYLGLNDAPGYSWILTYGAPGADTAYRILSNFADAQAEPVHSKTLTLRLDGGPQDLRLPATLPVVPKATVADVDAWWRLVGDPSTTSGVPDRLAWGYAWVRSCTEVSPVEWIGCGPFDPAFMMGLVHYGSDQGVYPPVSLNNPIGLQFDLVEVDITSRRLLYHYSLEDRGNVKLADVSLAEPPNEQAIGPAPTVLEYDGTVFAAVASGTFLVMLLVYLLPAIKTLAGRALVWTGFSRLNTPKVVEQRNRNLILEVVTTDPGINATAIAKRLPELGWSTIIYHLAVLERHGMVRSRVDGRRRRFFPKDASAADELALATLKNERTRSIYELLAAGATTRTQLARTIGISIPSVLWHLERLEGANLITRVKQEGRVLYARSANGSTSGH